MSGEDEYRPRPALTVLDVAFMSPVEVYGVLTFLIASQDEAVKRALSDATERVMIRSRLAPPP